VAKLNIPDGLKLFGANIVPKASDVIPDPNRAWVTFYTNWDWSGWVKPQVDYLLGNGVGANCIRVIGGQEGILSSLYSQSSYDDKILQLADYVTSQGAYFFACTGGIQTDLMNAIGGGLTPSQLAACQSITLKKLEKLNRIIGVDLIQEAQGGSIGNDYLIAVINAVKAAGVILPLTYSASCVNTSVGVPIPGPRGEDWLIQASSGGMGRFIDFIDVHLYFRTLDVTFWNQFYSAFPQHDIIIGEFGDHLGSGTASQIAWYQRFLAMGAAQDSRVRGALCWAATDQNTLTSERWGVYSDVWAARTHMLDELRKYTYGSLLKNNGAVR
jgi:hypothetical protein